MRRPRRCHVGYLVMREPPLITEDDELQNSNESKAAYRDNSSIDSTNPRLMMATLNVLDNAAIKHDSESDDFQPPIVSRVNTALFQRHRRLCKRKGKAASSNTVKSPPAEDESPTGAFEHKATAEQQQQQRKGVQTCNDVEMATAVSSSASTPNESAEEDELLSTQEDTDNETQITAAIRMSFETNCEREEATLDNKSPLFYSDRSICANESYQRISSVRWSAINQS